MAVIGILAALALPKLFGAICQSKIGRVDGVSGSISSALSMYFADNQTFPRDATSSGVDVSSYIVTKYMATAPVSPWLDKPYKYGSDGTIYTLVVAVDAGRGCDGVAGGNDGYRYYYSTSGKVGSQDASPL